MQERFMPYHIPRGWTVFFPEGWICTVNDAVHPSQVTFTCPDVEFAAYCIVWHFTQSGDGEPASVERLHWVFSEAALSHPMEEIDRRLYAPAGLSMRAYRGQTEDHCQMLAFAICTPGDLLSVYLVGDDRQTEQLLCRGVRRIMRTEAYAAAGHPMQDSTAETAAAPSLPPLPKITPRSEGGKPGNGPVWL